MPRLIPILLLDRNARLVKTVRFDERTYIGDPFNVIRIFNEKEVDEICVLDIDACVQGRAPDTGFIRELASECFMPLAYGGGLSSMSECEALFKSGVEKLIVGAQAPDGNFVADMSRNFGAQAVVVSVDVKRRRDGWDVCTHGGRRVVHSDPQIYAQKMAAAGAGEILLHDIDRDGMRIGYDLDLISQVANSLPVPLIALGGAGEWRHLQQGLAAGASAVASGSAFVFYGPLRAVLVTYPTQDEMRREIYPSAMLSHD